MRSDLFSDPSSDVAVDVAAYLSDDDFLDIVSASLEGRPALLAFEVDEREHARRLEPGIGAVHSRRLLHALWSLPEGLAWPVSRIDEVDLNTLSDKGDGLIEMDADSVTRLYRPAGCVRAIGLSSGRLTVSVSRASHLPPIVRRYAIATKPTASDSDASAAARAAGIGAAVAHPAGLRILARARPALRGVPGIYRWWLAEVAYGAWLQTKAH